MQIFILVSRKKQTSNTFTLPKSWFSTWFSVKSKGLSWAPNWSTCCFKLAISSSEWAQRVFTRSFALKTIEALGVAPLFEFSEFSKTSKLWSSTIFRSSSLDSLITTEWRSKLLFTNNNYVNLVREFVNYQIVTKNAKL